MTDQEKLNRLRELMKMQAFWDMIAIIVDIQKPEDKKEDWATNVAYIANQYLEFENIMNSMVEKSPKKYTTNDLLKTFKPCLN